VKLSEMAQALGCTLQGDGNLEIFGVAGIDEAQAGQVTFVSNPKYAAKAKTTSASAVIVSPSFQDISVPTLRTANPYLAFARAVEMFYEVPVPSTGISSSASIAASAMVGAGASIGPFTVIEDDVVIGRDCIIYPFVHIYRGARIGDNFKAYAHVSVREFSQIGNNVILQDGVKIGTDGYGYAKQDDGSYYKIVQSGIVVLEDDVEDRGQFHHRPWHHRRNPHPSRSEDRQSGAGRTCIGGGRKHIVVRAGGTGRAVPKSEET
jgi:UDP-3-O-[3-hydroxymyristoyl] glucosamine N-acyltransferase